MSTPIAQRWLNQTLSRQPHQRIGPDEQPYLLRWFVIKPNRWCNVYLHRFVGSDEPTPHDHPWDFISLCLQGSYVEESPGQEPRRRRAGHLAYRRAEHRHRVVLDDGGDGRCRPCTTVIITGPWRRAWGFWCPGNRFVPWRTFGPGGCGETTGAPAARIHPLTERGPLAMTTTYRHRSSRRGDAHVTQRGVKP